MYGSQSGSSCDTEAKPIGMVLFALLMALAISSCGGSSTPIEDWSSDIPFATAEPSRITRLLLLKGEIRFSDDCVELVAGQGDEFRVAQVILPAGPDIFWSESAQELRVGSDRIANGSQVEIGVRTQHPAPEGGANAECSSDVTIANNIKPAK